jgi:hypothetical protein
MTDLSEIATELAARQRDDDVIQSGVESPATGRSWWRRVVEPSSHVPTYVGVLFVLAGFALIGVGWGEVAGLTDVWRQVPYLVSAGLTGLGLIMTGLIFINVAARRQDGAERARQLGQLTEALQALQRAMDEE